MTYRRKDKDDDLNEEYYWLNRKQTVLWVNRIKP